MLILDSNALLWIIRGDRRVGARAQRRIERERELAVSLATPWELWIKFSNGRLPAPPLELEDVLDRWRVKVLPITLADARRAAELPAHHRDPFDRMIIAQALERNAPVMTGDGVFALYGVRVIDI
jgi:PIN domain nuclease of toxin-antitoxin system